MRRRSARRAPEPPQLHPSALGHFEAAASPRLRDDAERLARRLQRDIDLSRWSELMN